MARFVLQFSQSTTGSKFGEDNADLACLTLAPDRVKLSTTGVCVWYGRDCLTRYSFTLWKNSTFVKKKKKLKCCKFIL